MAELKSPCGCGGSATKQAPAVTPEQNRPQPRRQEVPAGMARLLRTARTAAVQGVGYARRGVIHTVPDSLVDDLLATREWERVDPAPVVERLTEPAPAQPAAKTTAKPKARSRAKTATKTATKTAAKRKR